MSQANFCRADQIDKHTQPEATLSQYPDHCTYVDQPCFSGATYAYKCKANPRLVSCVDWMKPNAYPACRYYNDKQAEKV